LKSVGEGYQMSRETSMTTGYLAIAGFLVLAAVAPAAAQRSWVEAKGPNVATPSLFL
jgi:hypothetical protein